MVCVVCGTDTKVINSRPQKKTNRVWRRRQCPSCGMAFTTEETIDYSGCWVVKRQTGALQPFLRDKLLLSLYDGCRHRKTALSDAAGLTDTVISKLSAHIVDGSITNRTLTEVALVALNRFDKTAAVHYAAYHRL